MNKNEKDPDERNLKEKIKNFWINYKKNWIWVNIGAYQGIIIFLWFLFFVGFLNLTFAILFTIFYPLAIFLAYYVRKSKHQMIFTKIILVGCGTLALGCPIWLFIGYVLITAPWAPLQALPAVLRGRILLLVVISSYGLAAYIIYKIGKKREWRPPSHLVN